MRYPLLGISLLTLALSTAQASEPNTTASAEPASVQLSNQLQAAPTASRINKDAADLAYDFIHKGSVTEGWNASKKTFVAVTEATFDSENPSYDDNFISKRSLKTMEATLEAKKQIINYIHTEMSVMDKVSTPGTVFNAAFNEKRNALQRKVDAQRRLMANMLEAKDAKEAEALRGVTFGDRANTLMDAAIKRLDSEYSSTSVEESKHKKYEQTKVRYQESLAEYGQLEQELKALDGSITEELSSTVEAISKMPLFGAITVAQFESWNEDEEQYKVALVTLWSAKQEEIVRALISGTTRKVPAGRQSLSEYLNSHNWATATGARKFRDSDGNFYIFGIAASPAGSSSSSEKKARGISELNAKKEVVTALYADVAAQEKAEQAMTVLNGGGKDQSIASESFSSELQQSLQNRQVQGLSRRFGRKMIHPISGENIYVSIYSIDSAGIANAKLMMKSQYETKLMDIKSQQQAKGVKEGYKQAVDAAGNDKDAYRQARAASAASLKTSATKPATRPASTTTDSTTQSSQSGAWEGGGNSDAADTFDW